MLPVRAFLCFGVRSLTYGAYSESIYKMIERNLSPENFIPSMFHIYKGIKNNSRVWEERLNVFQTRSS